MDSGWQVLLAVALVVNALIGFGYRIYRYGKGGPLSDVVGQAILGVLLLGIAVAVALGAGWARWPALVYAGLFGIVVMPLWVLAVLIPLRPKAIDLAFTGLYWAALVAIGVAALAL